MFAIGDYPAFKMTDLSVLALGLFTDFGLILANNTWNIKWRIERKGHMILKTI